MTSRDVSGVKIFIICSPSDLDSIHTMMRNRPVTVLVFILLLLLIGSSFIWPHAFSSDTSIANMSVTHTVLFQFKADAKPDDVKAVSTSLGHSSSPQHMLTNHDPIGLQPIP
jgi:hypothetical protein